MTPLLRYPRSLLSCCVPLWLLLLCSCGPTEITPEAACQGVGVEVTRAQDAPERGVPLGVVLIPVRFETSTDAWSQVLTQARKASPDLLGFGYMIWAENEVMPGVFDWSDLDPLVSLTGQEGLIFDVPTPVRYDAELDMPADLKGRDIKDAQLKIRYLAYIEEVASYAPAQTRYITLHTEGVLEYFDENPDQQEAYCALLSESAALLRARRPELKVGTYWRYENTDRGLFDCLNRGTDFIALAAILNPPDDRPEDIEQIITRYISWAGDKKIGLVEVGFPSSTEIDSSEAEQARFVNALFDAVDRHEEQLEFVSYFEVFNQNREITAAIGDMIFGNRKKWTRLLVEWLTTLGLKCEDGTPKQAWFTFLERAAR